MTDIEKSLDIRLSRLMLGTVQFGLNYGIANNSGQTTYENARDIIAYAFDSGVNCLDTAASYGNSEEVVGKALFELGIQDKMTVITKVPHIKTSQICSTKVYSFYENALMDSLRKLHLDVIQICLIHTEKDYMYLEELMKLKHTGLINHVGISVDTPAGAQNAFSADLAEAIQIPFNVLDRRFIDADILTMADKKNIALFTRSVYLQGLLLMPEQKILPVLQEIIPARRKLERLACQAGIDMVELCMRYLLSQPEITSILVGVDSLKQMKQNIKCFSKGALPEDLVMEIRDSIPNFSENIIRPCFWPNAKNK